MPPGPFHPDRDPASPVFYDAMSMLNLAGVHNGRPDFTVGLHTEDHPGVIAWGAASAHTLDLHDQDVQLNRHLHHGFFYTYLAAHQKSTDRTIPLYIVQWWVGLDYGYFVPGQGVPITSVNRRLFFPPHR